MLIILPIYHKNKTPRTSTHSRPRGFYTNYSTKSLEAVDNFCTGVVARSTTCAATGSNIALGISIDVAAPIQAALRTEKEVIDHAKAGRDGVLPPVGSSVVILPVLVLSVRFESKPRLLLKTTSYYLPNLRAFSLRRASTWRFRSTLFVFRFRSSLDNFSSALSMAA